MELWYADLQCNFNCNVAIVNKCRPRLDEWFPKTVISELKHFKKYNFHWRLGKLNATLVGVKMDE